MSYNLDCFVVVDPNSGTYLPADNIILLDTTLLSDEELKTFDSGTDNDRADIAEKLGVYLHDQINPQTLHYDTN